MGRIRQELEAIYWKSDSTTGDDVNGREDAKDDRGKEGVNDDDDHHDDSDDHVDAAADTDDGTDDDDYDGNENVLHVIDLNDHDGKPHWIASIRQERR